MDSFNKIISFALGLVVVLVFFAVVTGKINLRSKTSTTASKSILTPTPIQKNNNGFFGLFKSASPTPTPTQRPSTSTLSKVSENNIYAQNNQTTTSSNAKSIPSTGLPTVFIPILFSSLAAGNILRRTGKK
jgi:predicted PurR-regulated permease PerM